MDDREPADPLKSLGERIDKAFENRPGAGGDAAPSDGSRNAMAMGLRIGLELVVGVIAGVGIGYLLDRWLGSGPICVVLGLFLGFAAGIVNVYRAVTGIGMAAGYIERRKGAENPGGDESDED